MAKHDITVPIQHGMSDPDFNHLEKWINKYGLTNILMAMAEQSRLVAVARRHMGQPHQQYVRRMNALMTCASRPSVVTR
jgi:hypothetical protein